MDMSDVEMKAIPLEQCCGHGGRRCETERKTEIEIHGYHQKRPQEEWADRSQHSRSQGLEIGSFKGNPLTWKSLQGEKKVRISLIDVLATGRLLASWIAPLVTVYQ